MCLKCHQGLSDEYVLQSSLDSLSNPQFEKWNTTSLSHLFIEISGVNGEECSQLGLQLLDNYIQYKEHNANEKDGTLFGNPSAEYAKEQKTQALELKEKLKGFTQEEKKQYVFHGVEPVSSPVVHGKPGIVCQIM